MRITSVAGSISTIFSSTSMPLICGITRIGQDHLWAPAAKQVQTLFRVRRRENLKAGLGQGVREQFHAARIVVDDQQRNRGMHDFSST